MNDQFNSPPKIMSCIIDFPFKGGWIGDFPPKPPNKNDFYQYPGYPGTFLPSRPRVVDPRNEEFEKLMERLEKFKQGAKKNEILPSVQKALNDKNNFFPQEDGNLIFVLEMPGYGREHISVRILNDGNPYLEIEGDHEDRAMKDTFYIPDALKYNLHSGEVVMEYGILTITFESADYNKQEIVLL